MFYLITFNSIANIRSCILLTKKEAIISTNLKAANKGTKRANIPKNNKQT